mgnify:CR=1 FL=1
MENRSLAICKTDKLFTNNYNLLFILLLNISLFLKLIYKFIISKDCIYFRELYFSARVIPKKTLVLYCSEIRNKDKEHLV